MVVSLDCFFTNKKPHSETRNKSKKGNEGKHNKKTQNGQQNCIFTHTLTIKPLEMAECEVDLDKADDEDDEDGEYLKRTFSVSECNWTV